VSFKECGCGHKWETREDFMSDPTVEVVGYQVNFGNLQAGLFLFNHGIGKCRTTLAIPAGDFLDLHKGPIFKERLLGTPECGGECLHRDTLRPCPARCECSFVRDVLTEVVHWPKRPAA